ncbi:glycosyltransferase, partial [Saccharothrix sp. MB29]|nr:glycosyltransferase [Saccharothrix sp. MB29]
MDADWRRWTPTTSPRWSPPTRGRGSSATPSTRWSTSAAASPWRTSRTRSRRWVAATSRASRCRRSRTWCSRRRSPTDHRRAGAKDPIRDFPRVRVLALGHNVGASARNRGVRAADTPYVAFCDDDSWWAPGALDRAEELFREHPALGLVAARVVVEPEGREDPVCAEMASSPLGRGGDLPGPRVLGFICCASIVRREAFLRVGGFNPVLFFPGEERLFSWDMAAAG